MEADREPTDAVGLHVGDEAPQLLAVRGPHVDDVSGAVGSDGGEGDAPKGAAPSVLIGAGTAAAIPSPPRRGEEQDGDDGDDDSICLHTFNAEWDDEGVFVYQAFCADIASYAIEHQRLGGPAFKPARMTWIKPSFAWVLYRSGYAKKHNQEHILKIKLPHAALAELLMQCQCKFGGGGSKGRVQWDPERDLYAAEGREPRRMLSRRAVQIGLSQELSHFYVESAVQILDMTGLARAVGDAHGAKGSEAVRKQAMAALEGALPRERAYVPWMPLRELRRLRIWDRPHAEGACAGDAGSSQDRRTALEQRLALTARGRRRGGR